MIRFRCAAHRFKKGQVQDTFFFGNHEKKREKKEKKEVLHLHAQPALKTMDLMRHFVVFGL